MSDRMAASAPPLCDSISDVIGSSPMLHAHRLCKNPNVRLLLKLEYMNPSGSIKDRIVRHMLEELEHSGRLSPDSVIVENSSGNTAAALAMLCAVKGYRAVLVVPFQCSDEKVAIIRAFGAQVIVAEEGDEMSIRQRAQEMSDQMDGSVLLDQYDNAANVDAHSISTAPEIWCQSGGVVDMLVAGSSTGGTISGISRYLKQKNPSLTAVLADPRGSVLFSKLDCNIDDDAVPEAASEGDALVEHKRPRAAAVDRTQIEGLGVSPCDPVPACTLFEYIDRAVRVEDYDAIASAHALARVEGVFAGMSGGANVAAALKCAETITTPTTIVTIIPDGGFKYLSKLYSEPWLAKHNLPSFVHKQKAIADESGLACIPAE
eukprot:TRINITY_DN440_c0_g1_i2.p1 TRINITY_DN440_c0_g1~~TRINITY_DN440_c0_g1_i2.p1  ORF type:complete len:375 (-),score=128.61 TRINITY_DN440_c0_g1_i2:278-1402(-)